MNWKNSKSQTFTQVEVFNILNKVAEYKYHKIIVGTDSVKLGEEFVFANAICVINTNNIYDRRFFYSKQKILDSKYYDLSNRLLKETSDSIKIAFSIKEKIKKANIEIHADVNNEANHQIFL